MKKVSIGIIGFALIASMITSCKGGNDRSKSSSTGWAYNNTENGGFEVQDYKGQETGPGLVFVTGGNFMMGQKDEDVMKEWNNIPRKVTVNSFYMDETEVANVHYREYLYWLTRVFGETYPQVVTRALPDTLVWRDELAYNEPYTEYYFRHPSFSFYPVVGVTWLQANDFAKWRSDRVNEHLLVEKGVLTYSPEDDVDENNFTTQTYLAGYYEGVPGKAKSQLKDYSVPGGKGTRAVKFEDGILMPDYRLPTEAEWEYAAYSLIGNQPYKDEERFTDQRIYPWNGFSLRYPKSGKLQGDFLANFKRGRGDNMGLAPNLNDDASVTADVKAYYPNDFGLYNMAGNVNEWVLDVYRPMTSVDGNDFNTFRGNVYKTKVLDEEGFLAEPDTLGRIQYRDVTEEEAASRRNYRAADVRNYSDQDASSEVVYNYGVSSLINDNSRVFKGGSWKDRTYWLSPGTRRFLQEYESTDDLGFRCAMDRMGSPGGNKAPSGNQFKAKKIKR